MAKKLLMVLPFMIIVGFFIIDCSQNQATIVAKSTEELETQNVMLIDKIRWRKQTIMIDAGHGGDDPGSVNRDVLEKTLNLEVALKLEKALKKEGYKVIMTRSDDIGLGLYDRAKLANEAKVDLFISLHQNSFADSHVHGIEVFYNENKKSTQGKELAQLIQSTLVAETGAKNRGIRWDNKLVVTRETKMPACLIEMAYISNDAELALIQTDDYQNKVVKGIVKGVELFFE